MSKVYVLTDTDNRIIRIDGGYSEHDDLTGWQLIDEGEGDKYNLCQSNYLPQPVSDDNGIALWKLVNGQCVERTEDEIAADYKALPTPEPDKVKLFFNAIPVDVKPADRPGYKWEPIFNMTQMRVGWHEVVDPDYNPTGSGTYIDPYVYVNGMTVEKDYWYTDGDNIWEAVKTGIPTGFDDPEYFDIISV